MTNLVQFPIRSTNQKTTEMVDLEFVKWKMGPEFIQSVSDQILDFIELEVEMPVGGPDMDKFNDDLIEFLTKYFTV